MQKIHNYPFVYTCLELCGVALHTTWNFYEVRTIVLQSTYFNEVLSSNYNFTD